VSVALQPAARPGGISTKRRVERQPRHYSNSDAAAALPSKLRSFVLALYFVLSYV